MKEGEGQGKVTRINESEFLMSSRIVKGELQRE